MNYKRYIINLRTDAHLDERVRNDGEAEQARALANMFKAIAGGIYSGQIEFEEFAEEISKKSAKAKVKAKAKPAVGE